jgi:HK97 family phage portal protein
MATLQTADGRLLRSSGPSSLALRGGSFMPAQFPPMWSDGERWGPDGETVLKSYEALYRSQPVLSGAINKIARRAATLPFAAFTELPNGSREPVAREDSLATLLRRPRPRTSTVHLLTHIFTSLLVHGNALVAKLRGPDRDVPPIMLWPLDWARIGAYGEPGGDIEWWSTHQFADVERFIAAADTIHFAWTGPDGGQLGVSPLEQLETTLRLEDASQRFQTANFRNGNRPSSVVSLEGNPKRDAIELASAQIENLHKGVDRAGKTILLTNGAKIAPLSMTPVEASLVEQRRLNREEVAIVLDMGGPSLSDTTDASLGNVVERNRAFYRDNIPTWTELVVQTFEAQLLDMEPAWVNRVVRFDFSDKLKGEPQELSQIAASDVNNGLRTRNEGRKLIGLEPYGDPDDDENPANQLTVNANNQDTLESLDEEPEPVPEAPPMAAVAVEGAQTPPRPPNASR